MARDRTPAATLATTATWGLPDWRDEAAYGDVKRWTLGRWRWEFFRRRADVRTLFDERAEPQYEGDLAKWQSNCARTDLEPADRAYILGKAPLKPDDPRFQVHFTPEEQEHFGYMALYNPRIGDVSKFENTVEQRGIFDWAVSGERGDKVLPSRKLEKHHLVIAFSTDRPLAPQLAAAANYLKGLQKYRLGHHPQKRRHPTKWRDYLRALDAKEAGVTWAKIAEVFFEEGLLDRSKDPSGGYCAPPPQAARDIWEQARALCFNF